MDCLKEIIRRRKCNEAKDDKDDKGDKDKKSTNVAKEGINKNLIKSWRHFCGTQKHTYHIVTRSPWPILAAIGVFIMMVGLVMLFHAFISGTKLVVLGLGLTIFVAYNWWSDVIYESTILGYHTKKVVKGLRLGMVLFIISEIMFFFSFFWAFFHSSLAPHVILGAIWPPVGIITLNPLTVPLINTFILLLSGLFVTVSHYSLCLPKGYIVHMTYDIAILSPEISIRDLMYDLIYNLKKTLKSFQEQYLVFYIFTYSINAFALCVWTLGITIFLAIEFTFLQWCEYSEAFFVLMMVFMVLHFI